MNSDNTLIYIHDPMCSWCYGFKPTLQSLTEKLDASINIKYFLGGLANDTDEPMPENMQQQIKDNWKRIETSIPGIIFNYQFWSKCIPRRSTYASCRAILAAKKQNSHSEINMLEAIQNAYYKNAKNPSDYTVLYELADECNLDMKKFISDIHSETINDELLRQISYSREIGADSFPSLYLLQNQIHRPIVLDYNNVDIIIEHLNTYI